MKKLLLILTICLTCTPFYSEAACNWKNKITSFIVRDSCGAAYKQIFGKVTLSSSANITYSWKVVNSTVNWTNTGSTYLYYPGSNGTYTVCLTLKDVVNKCDTTICQSISFNCLPVCQWYRQNVYLRGWDSCKSNGVWGNSVGGLLFTNNNWVSKYKYQWKVNGTIIHDTSSYMNHTITTNGTYVVCVKVSDTVNNCDTTICQTFNVTCISNCNWKGRAPNLSAWDSCHIGNKQYHVMGGISFNGNFSGKYPCVWKINGTTISGSGPVFQYPVTQNGTYTVCVKVRDTIKNCDTTFCRTVVVNCLPCGKWKSQIASFHAYDTCDQYPGKVYGRVDGLMGRVTMTNTSNYYKYKWTINAVTVSTLSGFLQYLPNGTYTVCLTITDTVTKCDTTLCKTIVFICKSCTNWKSVIKHLHLNDTCDQYPGKVYGRVDGVTGLLTMPNYSDYFYYKLKWTINSVPLNGSSARMDETLPNGTHTVCLTIRDTVKQCDTTVCRTITVNCAPCAPWKSRIAYFKVSDSCGPSNKFLFGKIILYSSANITYSWKVMGSTINWTSTNSTYMYYPGSNGTYTVCLTLKDKAKNCDTTICQTVNFNCLQPCKWYKQNIYLRSWDSCKSRGNSENSIGGTLFTNGNYFSKYKYQWKINGTVVTGNTGDFHYLLNANGTYIMCVKVTDSANNCDTTLCRTYTVNCINNCNWKGRKPVLYTSDSCNLSSKTYIITCGISFNGSYSGKYPCEWMIAGNKMPGSGPVISCYISANGTYPVCVKVRDTINNCDTIFCGTVVVNCIPCGPWKSQITNFYVNDTCDQYPNKIYNRLDGVVGWVTLSSSAPSSRYKYKWTVNSVQVSTSSGIAHVLKSNGTYTVCLTIRDTVNQCDTTLCRTVYVYCFQSGLSSLQKQQNLLNIYPNPAGNVFRFDWNGEACTYELSDVLGHQISRGTVENGINTISSAGLLNGVYWIRIYTAEGVMHGKVMVSH